MKISLIRLISSVEYLLGDIIEAGVIESGFLNENYFATNLQKPTNEILRKWLGGEIGDEDDLSSLELPPSLDY